MLNATDAYSVDVEELAASQSQEVADEEQAPVMSAREERVQALWQLITMLPTNAKLKRELGMPKLTCRTRRRG